MGRHAIWWNSIGPIDKLMGFSIHKVIKHLQKETKKWVNINKCKLDGDFYARLLSSLNLLYKVKMQYVQISNIIDTSIKRPISGQSTLLVKGCMDIMFDMVDTACSY